jgi:hypothetical protein
MSHNAANRVASSLALAMALSANAASALPVGEGPGVSGNFEHPSFRRHVMPLLGRLGCNSRACHGSFQGQGGFKLSLFGSDFAADHAALITGDRPRIDRSDAAASRILEKPTLTIPHKGGKRFEKGSWQYRLLAEWIAAGAKNDAAAPVTLTRLEVEPRELVFARPAQNVALRVIAHWSDRTSEDVTDLCRFSSSDATVAAVDLQGRVTASGKGDTHVIAFYDNGIAPVPVLVPSSDQVNDHFPTVSSATRIDELVLAKLRRLGIVPSERCTDTEFLRRISLDLTGTLPTPNEIEAFLADPSRDKRASKIDELLNRPTYAAWWATRLCDITGNNGRYREGPLAPDMARQWYEWMRRRAEKNVPYDEIVAGILLATSRRPGEAFEDYTREMSDYYRKEHPADFAARDTLPWFWSRITMDRPEDKALAVSHAFMGIRMQCAQCHKHPFDQWTRQDFNQFTALLRPVVYGTRPEDRPAYAKMEASITGPVPGDKDQKVKAPNLNLVRDGQTIPWREVYVASLSVPVPPSLQKGDNRLAGAIATPAVPPPNPNLARTRNTTSPPPVRGRLPGGPAITVPPDADPRAAILNWLRRPDNPYFARAFVNRVWAAYFNMGIIEPPDDLSRANPPTNGPLLDYLARGFIEHHYDMKLLHREIANSDTYQRSWHPTGSNRLDQHNFSHAIPRRLPAEVAYDAVAQATAGAQEIAAWNGDPKERIIALGAAPGGKKLRANYALNVFGRPERTSNCDCERANDPTLLQTLFLLNDADVRAWLDHQGGWLSQVMSEHRPWLEAKDRLARARADIARDKAARARAASGLRDRIEILRKQGKSQDAEALEHVLAALRNSPGPSPTALDSAAQAVDMAPAPDENGLIREAYLRTVSRPPTGTELARAHRHFDDIKNPITGVRDLMWALVNTNEFIVNH